MNKTESAQKGRISDYLVTQLEAKILSNNIKDGEKLPSERELMNQYDVSRTVVREAIATLSSKGLIITKPRFRPIARKPNIDSALDSINGIVTHLLSQSDGVKNLFDTRLMIEAMLVREAAINANKDDIKALREALKANYLAINDSDEFYTTDVLFHSILYSIPNNPIFPSVQKAFVNWLSNHWKKMGRLSKRNELNYYAHKKIFEAILNRDPDEAEKALREHLNTGWKDIEKTFK
ncbi:FCD domain-containing protein [Poseidonibacter ostreae]|jgi:GntR family transcriptional regulator, sialic acid-inducible nan operon repressor|uniref:FCD domain-containing protein n=1 Tax=Poseidonibacter ostreae TaxID=2654171 RepID=A0A6L4WVE8_9BACT|nr:FCD domain-containing protein [Poseidonibacter ostreae]KAB7886849.1 FCD domain-containing protein [Poseidonibacter ostreae]KAB7890492.1 FCD domain-containing protein [Poseidonibacter ostreae]KAB7890915.1 FCD domain-containing protein [Poseidonibacter ostreae]MAC83132.1 GntR family transcriptional regulator [Arcobacter sp.]|tara:strand:+ start:8689 stop:9396 length:708 start_codon:yes stop_codon:yes gene_type:complete